MTAFGALAALIAFPLAPSAAADTGQPVLVDSGTVRCLVSADNVARGGGPMVVCQRTAGLPFAQSTFSAEKHSVRLPLAVKLGTGEFYWAKGDILGSGEATDLSPGQSRQIDGWTIEAEKLRTRFTYEGTDHGFYVAEEDINQF